jgi:Restriction endonuclease EcoRV
MLKRYSVNMFERKLSKYFQKFINVVSSNNGEWTVKGFIDIYKNIYTISIDTKVISKIVELMIFPIIVQFANENNYNIRLASHQNHYPDITLIEKTTGEKIALDLKSTYRIDKSKVNGMTLGAFTEYFRNRTSTKNTTFSYNEYSKHYILGIIYSKTEVYNAEKVLEDLKINLSLNAKKFLIQYISNSTLENFNELYNVLKNSIDKDLLKVEIDKCLIDEKKVYTLDNLESVLSVVRDFDFFLQEKWKIAIDRPGSGNTKNIGSVNKIDELKNGKGLFTNCKNGEKLFSEYWINYLTGEMARSISLEKPHYSNFKEYLKYKKL